MNEIDNPYYRAAYSKYVAEQDESVANLLTLFNRPVGIGEHTDFLTEIDKWVNQGANALDKIQFIANVFSQNEDKNIVPNNTPDIPQENVQTSAQGA
jgi:hypothetical protein